MIDALLPIVLVVSIASLAVTVRTLQSSRRAEDLSEDRYELLREQYDWLEMLREERRMLTPNFRAKCAGSHSRASSENAGDLSSLSTMARVENKGESPA